MKFPKVLKLSIFIGIALNSISPASAADFNYSVYQKSLATFSASSTTLSATQKLQIEEAVKLNPQAEKFICTGIRYSKDPLRVNIMVRARAKAACEYAKQLNPNLSTWYQSKPTDAKPFAGKVLLTVKTLDQVQDSLSEQVLSKAVDEIRLRLANAKPFEGEINAYVSDGYPQSDVDSTIEATKLGVSYLSDEYQFQGADFIFFTPDEIQWAQTKWNEITSGTSLSGLSIYDKSWIFPCRSAEYTYQKNGATKHITYQCYDGRELEPVNFGAHGTIHWFQGFYNPQNMPNWLVEGSATLYGEVIGYGVDNPKAKQILWRGDYLLHDALKAGPASIRTEIAKVEVKNPPSAIYTTGRMLYTALIGLHGEAKAIEYMKSFGSSSDEKQNFLAIYGFTLEEFYQSAIPLMAEWAVRDWK